MRATIVDLPDPDAPTTAMEVPEARARDKPYKAGAQNRHQVPKGEKSDA